MWDKVKSFVTAHPYVIAGGILGLGILWLLSRGGSASASEGGPSDALQMAQLSAGVQIAGIQAQSSGQSRAIDAGLTQALAGFSTQEFIAQLTASLEGDRIDASTDVALAQISAGSTAAGYSRDVQIATINALSGGRATPGGSDVNYGGVDWSKANGQIDMYSGFSSQAEYDAFRRTYTGFTGQFGEGRFERFVSLLPRANQVSFVNALVQRKADPDYISYEIGQLRPN